MLDDATEQERADKNMLLNKISIHDVEELWQKVEESYNRSTR